MIVTSERLELSGPLEDARAKWSAFRAAVATFTQRQAQLVAARGVPKLRTMIAQLPAGPERVAAEQRAAELATKVQRQLSKGAIVSTLIAKAKGAIEKIRSAGGFGIGPAAVLLALGALALAIKGLDSWNKATASVQAEIALESRKLEAVREGLVPPDVLATDDRSDPLGIKGALKGLGGGLGAVAAIAAAVFLLPKLMRGRS